MNENTKNENATETAGQVQRLVMREYSEGIAADGAAILCDGQPMRIEEILARLRALEVVRGIIYDAPELNPCNYDHDDACELNAAMCEAWSVIEADA